MNVGSQNCGPEVTAAATTGPPSTRSSPSPGNTGAEPDPTLPHPPPGQNRHPMKATGSSATADNRRRNGLVDEDCRRVEGRPGTPTTIDVRQW